MSKALDRASGGLPPLPSSPPRFIRCRVKKGDLRSLWGISPESSDNVLLLASPVLLSSPPPDQIIVVIKEKDGEWIPVRVLEERGGGSSTAPWEVRERGKDFQSPWELATPLHRFFLISETENYRPEVPLFNLPCMVKSEFCTLSRATEPSKYECTSDCGGYFIVNGNEKALLGQHKLRVNSVYVFAGKSQSKFAYVAEVRAQADTKWRSTSTLKIGITSSRPPQLIVHVPFVGRGQSTLSQLDIPLTCMLKCLEPTRMTTKWRSSFRKTLSVMRNP